MHIKAIETVYDGYNFRSRLEARWAVFFDDLDIDWGYEIEGFELERVRYLPDFYLHDLKLFVEIKPEIGTSGWDRKNPFCTAADAQPGYYERRKVRTLAESGRPAIILYREPRDLLASPAFSTLWYPEPSGDYAVGAFKALLLKNPRHTLDAANHARAARFEHGETP